MIMLVLSYGILRTSRVQTWLAGKAAAYLSAELGTSVTVGGLDISWFFDIVLENIAVKDQSGRDLLKAGRISIDLGKLDRKERYLGIYSVGLNGADINLFRNRADSLMNYGFIVNYFAGTDTAAAARPGKPWKIGISGIKIKDSRFLYRDELKKRAEAGVDYNFIRITDLNLELRKLKIENDSMTGSIRQLSLREKSGFILSNLSAEVKVTAECVEARELHIETPASDLNLDLKFTHQGYNVYNHFIDSVFMQGAFRDTRLNFSDIAFFAPEIKGMNNEIRVRGLVKGTVSSLKARNFSFAYGNNTAFEGNITMDGLPDIRETFIHLKVRKLTTDAADLSMISLPGAALLEIPEILKTAGRIAVKGYFTGFYNDFVSSASFTTGLGTMVTDVSLKMGRDRIIDYNGHLNLAGWDLGQTLSQETVLGKVDFSSTITGRIEDFRVFDVNMDALVSSIGLYGNVFHNIKIDGELKNREFNGELILRDKLVNLDFRGMLDFTDSLPELKFTSTVKNAYLSRLNLWDRDSSSCLSTRMDLDFKGSNIDNLLGSLRFDSTVYREKGTTYRVKEVMLMKHRNDAGHMDLDLRSDFADADFNGIFSFDGFYNSTANIISAYLPSIRPTAMQTQVIEKDQLFDYTVRIKNIDPLTELFLPGFELEGEASLFGSFNSASETILMNGQARRFVYAGIVFNDWFIRGQNTGHIFELQTGASGIVWKDATEDDPRRLGVENFSLNTLMVGDSLQYRLNWINADSINRNKGLIAGTFLFTGPSRFEAYLDKAEMLINNAAWNASQEGNIRVDSTMVSVDNLLIRSSGQELRLNGVISENPGDVFNLWFDNLDISLLDAVISRNDLEFDGIVSGKVTLTDFYHARTLQSDLSIETFAFNGERMGDARINSWWDKERSALGIDANIIYKGNVGTHHPLLVNGFIYPGKRHEGNFDLYIDLVNYKLASLNPFLKGFASGLKGMASGDLRMEGTFERPEITGNIQLLRTQMKIDYLNVTYSLADQVRLEPGLIAADNIMVYDSVGNSGLLDFRLTHDHFRRMELDMHVKASNLAGLNTTSRHNEMFYGTAFATGDVRIRGPFDNIKINLEAASGPNTNIFIPINLAVGATENEFIRFVNREATEEEEPDYVANTSGVNLDMLLDVNKNANIQIFLPEDIGNIKGNGEGKISMGIDTRGDITMFGDYIMNSGTFLFTFRNIFNRVFSIEKGSVISFRGSPYEADIDLRAVYKLKASLKSIPELADDPAYAGKSTPVDCIISLENNLYNPDIRFSFRLPEANEIMNQKIFAAIDTTNEAVMTQQMVSLLVMKSFSFASSTNSLAGSVGSSSIEVLTNQLSNMLSQISNDVDIGVNYRTGDALSSEELEVALSTHLFNDRVTIDGNVGVTTTGSTANTNNLVGDVTVDIKITPDGRFRVKAFNKANNPFDISSSYAPYRQGVGVYYRFEFDKFSELFRRNRKNQPSVYNP